jgi:UDP-N-acetylmuramyl pentapeptide synthase
MNSSAEESTQEETVELTFPAIPELVVLARFAASAVAARAGFDVEEIEDLRLAVDELCASIGQLGPESCVRMEFRRTGGVVRVQCVFEPRHTMTRHRRTHHEAHRSPGDLSVQLLGALVDDHGFEDRNGFACGWLEKRRGFVTR